MNRFRTARRACDATSPGATVRPDASSGHAPAVKTSAFCRATDAYAYGAPAYKDGGLTRRTCLAICDLSGFLACIAELIAETVHCMQIARTLGGISERSADAPHMHVDGARVALEVKTPHRLDKLVTGEDASFVASEQPQQIKFAGLEADKLSIHGHLAAVSVHAQVADGPPFGRLHGLSAAAAQHR